MEDAKWKSIAKGLAIGLAYGVAYLVLRHLSFNQWFLPAGLRCGSLLLAPYRYWPFIIAGDIAALLYLRVPKVEQYGELWAYGSPVLLIALIAVVAHAWRSRLKSTQGLQRWLPVVALTLAAWSAASNMLLNYFLDGPRPLVNLKNYIGYTVGDFLGILLILLPCLLWLHRHHGIPLTRRLWWQVSGAVVVTIALYLGITVPQAIDDSTRLLLLMLMIVPAVYLTFFEGWRGAAVGVVVANFAVARTLTYSGIPGYGDDVVLFSQQALLISACALLFLGRMISDHYERALRSGMAERQALTMARTSFLSTERVLREQLLCMAQMQLMIDGERRDLAEWLKVHGRYDAAMQLNSSGMLQRQNFDGQAMALYPIRIEQDGLFKAVHGKAFSDFWAGEAEIAYGFRGPISKVSVDLQLVAYRCICHAMALLSDYSPDEFRLNMRAWSGRSTNGIFVRLEVVPTGAFELSQAGMTAETLLAARIKAHGGAMRRHGPGISFLLAETPGSDSA